MPTPTTTNVQNISVEANRRIAVRRGLRDFRTIGSIRFRRNERCPAMNMNMNMDMNLDMDMNMNM